MKLLTQLVIASSMLDAYDPSMCLLTPTYSLLVNS